MNDGFRDREVYFRWGFQASPLRSGNRDLKDMTQQVTQTPGEMAEGIVSVRNKVVNKRVYQGGQ